jgi:hypothetical protein
MRYARNIYIPIVKTLHASFEWCRTHSGKVFLFILGLVGIVSTIFYLKPYYDVANRRIVNGVYYQEDKNGIKKVSITVERASNKDIYRLSLFLRNDAAGSLVIKLPAYLKRRPQGHHFLVNVKYLESAVRGEERWFYYNINPATDSNTAPQFWEEYEGPIFSTSAREQAFDILIDLPRGKEVPVEISLLGLKGLNVSNVIPTPIFLSDYAMGFELLPNEKRWDGRDWGSISFYTIDRYGSYKKDFVLLLGGVLIGIFSSLLVSILVSLVDSLEHQFGGSIIGC